MQADEAETALARTNVLPHDPLLGLAEDEEINLPLTAFCYLIRRLSVSPSLSFLDSLSPFHN